MASASDHKNVKISPPFGTVDEVVEHRLKAHITVASFEHIPEDELVLLASRKSKDGLTLGHWVKFTVGALAVSVVQGSELGLRDVLDDIKPHQRLGAVVVTGLVTSEFCGDELSYYKNDCFARVVVTEPTSSPRSRFLTGTLQLMRNSQIEDALRLHEGLEPF